MANSLRSKLSKLRYKKQISDEEYRELTAKLDGHDKELLAKIRSEIEQLASRYTISRERGGMGQVEWADRLIRETDILQILDKYKAESGG